MADFDPPFAWDGPRRLPTSTEVAQGFLCGPADQSLFNMLYHRLEAEVGEVINFAGITGSDADLTQLRQAIAAMIAAATGGGDTSQFLLLSQARARLPIFPETLTPSGKIAVTSTGAGNVRLPAGVGIQHRGIYPFNTILTDYVTTANKAYHLRWNQTDGFTLRDLANVVYNPGVLAETDPSFDSTYDDMLIARVITNASNIPTITNLINSNQLYYQSYTGRLTDSIFVEDNVYGANSLRRNNNSFTYDFARTPRLDSINAVLGASTPMPSPTGVHGIANVIFNKVVTRYSTRFDLVTDYVSPSTGGYVEIYFGAMG